MISGIDLKETIDYICKNDAENPTIWKLGIIPGTIMGKLAKEAKEKSDQIDFLFKVVRLGLRGWVNYNPEFKTTKEIIYDRECDMVTMDLIDAVPLVIVGELAEQIFKINNLQTSEIKN